MSRSLLLLLSVTFSMATQYTISGWTYGYTGFTSQAVVAGDTVVWDAFSQPHNVCQTSSLCSGFGSPLTTGATYTLDTACLATGTYFYGCNVGAGTHCSSSGGNMQLTLTVSNGPAASCISSSAGAAGGVASSSALAMTTSSSSACGQTFTFTAAAADRHYTVDGSQSDPTLQLTVGCVYVFVVNVDSSHPLVLTSNAPGGTGTITPISSGVTGTMDISSGTFTFTPSAPENIFYQCSVHLFGGSIAVTDSGGAMNAASTAVASVLLAVLLMLSVLVSLLV